MIGSSRRSILGCSAVPSFGQVVTTNKMADVETKGADPKNVQDLTAFVQTLLTQMQDKFQNMSDQIINRIDDMGGRIDDLEKNIADLMTQAGVNDGGV